MQPIYVLKLASQHQHWATVRQAAITGNIANANSPGYAAVDVEPFSAVLDKTESVAMAQTMPGHVNVAGEAGDRAWQTKETGKTVALDQQLVLADETNRAFSLDTSVVRAFHRMLMMAVRSGV